MIEFKNLNLEEPFQVFKKKYDEAASAGQKSIEAIAISSYNIKQGEVESRYVNLKSINNDKFIFFTNYNSPKATSFNFHDQISALIFWPSINTQIRIKAQIKKTSIEYNQEYFLKRSKEKNALAISSNQSQNIESYIKVKENFLYTLKNDDLKKCPKYWGGYAFTPYEIEFWKGNDYRLNERDLYTREKKIEN